MAIEQEENLPYMVIPVDMEDGTQIECEVLAIFPVEGKQYIALIDKDNDYSDIWLYRFVPVGDEEFNTHQVQQEECT